jgi:C1A family cysteine protease
MNKLIFVLGAVALVTISMTLVAEKQEQKALSLEKSQWESWKLKHSKNYHANEELYRFAVFRENLKMIEEHKTLGKTYTLGLTEYADLTQAEFQALYIGQKWDTTKLKNRPPRLSELKKPEVLAQTQTINWTQKNGIVGPVNNQGQCGSCWSFSATESIQSILALAGQPLQQLSEEQLVQCSGAYGNEGCNGGWPYQAFEYVMANPLATNEIYPYVSGTGVTGNCKANLAAQGTAKISDYNDVSTNDGADGCINLQTALVSSPVSVCVDAANWSALYTGGIYPADECGDEIDHAVFLVGSSPDAWLIQNSWGTSWGENGYIQLAPGNTCAVCTVASVPVA